MSIPINFSLAIHGGAGTISKNELTTELEIEYKNALQQALQAGKIILEKGGNALDAVTFSTVALENNVLFNAGKGSVFTNKGVHEMDAAIMCGNDLKAGAVAGVHSIKNPILLAKKIMEKSDHVLLSGSGATEFAIKENMEFETNEYFFSKFRFQQWQQIKNSNITQLDHTSNERSKLKIGTVGAVAKDVFGNLAAATSTGGMTNKAFGRIGDTPLIGSGTYAKNSTCAISCTGHGEPFIKAVAAYDVSCLIEYAGLTIEQAMYKVLFEKLKILRGEGGMIGVDSLGNISMQFNTEGMYRAMCTNLIQEKINIF